MLTKYNPFGRTLRRYDSGLGDVWNRPLWGFRWNTSEVFGAGFGAMDVQEDDDGLSFTADLPGLDRDKISVEAKDGVLTLSAERSEEKEEKGKVYHRYERCYGSFCRSFRLPENADTEKIEAKYTEGVLTVRVPKTEESKPRKIEVTVS